MAMRRRPGMAGLKRMEHNKQSLQKRGQEAQEEHMQHIASQVALFKDKLQEFARAHKKEINSDPIFRSQFQRMCREIGVDPLASNRGFWAQILGFGDFYYELAVQLIEVCIATRPLNGGLIPVPDLLRRLRQLRGPKAPRIGEDDIRQAVRQVRQLGSGFRLLELDDGGPPVLLSQPVELNTDHLRVVQLAQRTGGMVSEQLVVSQLPGWDSRRWQTTLDLLLPQGMVWVDRPDPPPQPQQKPQQPHGGDQPQQTTNYFFVGLFLQTYNQQQQAKLGVVDDDDDDDHHQHEFGGDEAKDV